jgi:hypothetical protein
MPERMMPRWADRCPKAYELYRKVYAETNQALKSPKTRLRNALHLARLAASTRFAARRSEASAAVRKFLELVRRFRI